MIGIAAEQLAHHRSIDLSFVDSMVPVVQRIEQGVSKDETDVLSHLLSFSVFEESGYLCDCPGEMKHRTEAQGRPGQVDSHPEVESRPTEK